MKQVLMCCLPLTILLMTACKSSKPYDSVKLAEITNNPNIDKGVVNPNVVDFFIRISDACMMNIQEGELAAQKGTTNEIKNYGRLMVNDHTLLLTKIKKMAASMQIVLPATISNSKRDGLETLSVKEGKSFDEKFIKMMRAEHERDIKDFTRATGLIDENVHNFAMEYLPMKQNHLDKAALLKEKEEKNDGQRR